MNCSISGEKCETPVVSPDGHIYEKSLILKYLSQDGKCPITDKKLNPDELIQIKHCGGPICAKISSETSISSLLKLFQNEWDNALLETFELKKQLQSVKQQLSNSLYQYDASCRVIGRLVKERDEARNALNDTQNNISTVLSKHVAVKRTNSEIGENGNGKAKVQRLNSSTELRNVVKEIASNAITLSKQRSRDRKKLREKVMARQLIENFELKKTLKMQKELESLEMIESKELRETVIIGGQRDGTIDVKSWAGESEMLKFHDSAVCCLSAISTKEFLSGDENGRVVRWTQNNGLKFQNSNLFELHEDKVTDISVQPMAKQFVTSSLDKTWSFVDLATSERLHHSAKQNAELLSIEFHPDGLILGIGSSDKKLDIWDLKSLQSVAVFEGHSDGVSTISFSENGYYLASGDSSGVVKLWDLRKSQNIATINVTQNASENNPNELSKISFCPSGGYLGVSCNSGLFLYETKTWEKVTSLGESSNALCFGDFSPFVASASCHKGTVEIFSNESL